MFAGQEDPERSKTIGRRKKFKEGSNVLTKMPKILGPLGMLYECMESRIRIKVYTRNARGVRGHVEAYVAAFDKHWNLALEDCFEVWTRKRKRKAPAALGFLFYFVSYFNEDSSNIKMFHESYVNKKLLKYDHSSNFFT
ncbi:hypothetical protein HZH68_011938 [Vespula germanica]|uniref:Sm domain-containing protein n=1 Tax=Vespula germanica TaxID=30212 RepID=A0A834JKA2_VESGE|nr:hypothetical protein HZH68_011938 [Vespula germanica]